jgi:hypothetical protein
MRHSLLVLSSLILWRFWASFRLPEGAGRIPFGEWQPTQQVMLLFIVANFLYNNPFFWLWWDTGLWYYQLFEMLEESMFVHVLMLWVLVVFQPGTSHQVSGSHLLFVGSRWCVDSLYIVLRQLALRADSSASDEDLPLYPWVWVYFKHALTLAIFVSAVGLISNSFRLLLETGRALLSQVTHIVSSSSAEMPRDNRAVPGFLTILFLGFGYNLQQTEGSTAQLTAVLVAVNVFILLIAQSVQPGKAVLKHFTNLSKLRKRPIAARDNIDEDEMPADVKGSASKKDRDELRKKLEVMGDGMLQEQLTLKIQHASAAQLGQYVIVGLLMAAILVGTVGTTLPVRYETTEWPVQRCPNPTMEFSSSVCSGVDFAGGQPFIMRLPVVHSTWQNIEISALIHNRQWEQHGISATTHLRQHVTATSDTPGTRQHSI